MKETRSVCRNAIYSRAYLFSEGCHEESIRIATVGDPKKGGCIDFKLCN